MRPRTRRVELENSFFRPRDAGGYILWKLRLQILRAEVDLNCLAHLLQVPAPPERRGERPPRAGAVKDADVPQSGGVYRKI